MRRLSPDKALVDELRHALIDHDRFADEANGLMEGMSAKARLIRDLMKIVEFHIGRSGLDRMLDGIGANGVDLPMVAVEQSARTD